MHIAAANGYSKVVEFLLENHAAVDAVDKDLWTPVHAAACWGHVSVIELDVGCHAIDFKVILYCVSNFIWIVSCSFCLHSIAWMHRWTSLKCWQ